MFKKKDIVAKFITLAKSYHLNPPKDNKDFLIEISLRKTPKQNLINFIEAFSNFFYDIKEFPELKISISKSSYDSSIFNVIENWNAQKKDALKVYSKKKKYIINSEEDALLFAMITSLIEWVYETFI
jgi:hypothetical protein